MVQDDFLPRFPAMTPEAPAERLRRYAARDANTSGEESQRPPVTPPQEKKWQWQTVLCNTKSCPYSGHPVPVRLYHSLLETTLSISCTSEVAVLQDISIHQLLFINTTHSPLVLRWFFWFLMISLSLSFFLDHNCATEYVVVMR